MAAPTLEPTTIGGILLEVPDQYDRPGRGSMRATAWRKGAKAASRGEPESSCPYKPGPGSGSFRVAWCRGHEAFLSAKAWRNER